jgi:4-amino-4-deoxy-L-arabinose transferase-like glycosyltransferase
MFPVRRRPRAPRPRAGRRTPELLNVRPPHSTPPDAPLSRRAIVLLLVVVTIAWFAGIDRRALIGPDEGRYAEIAREMVATGDWLTPRLNGLKYFEKPPLQYWMTALAYEALGVREGAARLWPVIASFAGVLFLGYVGFRLGGLVLAVYAAAALAGCIGYVANGHLLTLDGALGAFLAIAFGAFVLAQRDGVTARERRNFMWLAWTAMAGATLSKGLIGVVIPGASLVLYTLATRDVAVWRRLHVASGAAIYLVLTAPWFIAVSLANSEFAHFFFIHEHVERFLTTTHGRAEPWWYFIPIFLVGMLPWLAVLTPGLRRAWRWSPAPGAFAWPRFALLWAAFVFVFFSASGSKLPSYVLPMFAPLALVAAWLLVDIDPRALLRQSWPLAAVLAVLLVAVFVGYATIARRVVKDDMALAAALAFGPWVKTALLVLAAGSAIALVALARGWPRARTVTVVALSLGSLGTVQITLAGYDEFRTTRSSRDMLRLAVAANGPFDPALPFYHVHMYDQTTPFYLKRTTTFVAYRGEFALGQDVEPGKAYATEGDWLPVWHALAQGYAMMDVPTFERMSREGVPMKVLARDSRRVIVSRR